MSVNTSFDLLLRGGRVIDPAAGIDGHPCMFGSHARSSRGARLSLAPLLPSGRSRPSATGYGEGRGDLEIVANDPCRKRSVHRNGQLEKGPDADSSTSAFVAANALSLLANGSSFTFLENNRSSS